MYRKEPTRRSRTPAASRAGATETGTAGPASPPRTCVADEGDRTRSSGGARGDGPAGVRRAPGWVLPLVCVAGRGARRAGVGLIRRRASLVGGHPTVPRSGLTSAMRNSCTRSPGGPGPPPSRWPPPGRATSWWSAPARRRRRGRARSPGRLAVGACLRDVPGLRGRIVAIRVAFHIALGTKAPGPSSTSRAHATRLGGGRAALRSGDLHRSRDRGAAGFRLAVLVVCFGAANALPTRDAHFGCSQRRCITWAPQL